MHKWLRAHQTYRHSRALLIGIKIVKLVQARLVELKRRGWTPASRQIHIAASSPNLS